jgi:HEAT repeats
VHSSGHWQVRAAAVRALGHEGDEAAVGDRARADRHLAVRIEAINALGNIQQDRSTAALLREIAVSGRHPRARAEALEALARQADNDTRAFIRQRASLDPHPAVRLHVALARAAKDHRRWDIWPPGHPPDAYLRFPDLSIEDSRLDGEARAALRELAVIDPDKRVRAAALRTLATKMRHDDQSLRLHDDTEALLRDHAASDKDPGVRAVAAQTVAGDDNPGWDDTDNDAPAL